MTALRAGFVRFLMLVILLISPVLFPVLLIMLRILDGEWARGGLVDLYRWCWRRLVRGYL